MPDRSRRLQPRVRRHCQRLRHERSVHHLYARLGGTVPRLPEGDPNGSKAEFTSRAFMAWAHARSVRPLINDAGMPLCTLT